MTTKLIDVILSSCKKLPALPNVKGFLVATHSPFIFTESFEEGGEIKSLGKYAVGMGQCRIG